MLLLVLSIPSHAFAEQFMCGGDFDGDGYADHQGEVIACIKTRYCGSSGASCNGNFDCTIRGSCSQGSYSEYVCSDDNLTYFTLNQCQSACSGDCFERPVTRYACSTNGRQYPTIQNCQSSCPDQTDQCLQRWDCPFGNSYPCVDIDNPINVNLIRADMRYLRDDGVRNPDSCGGNVYVLNGKPGECKKDGFRTNYSNCCETGGSKCDTESVEQSDGWTVRARGLGECHGLGEYCREEWRYIGCVQRGEVDCCFSTLGLGRILHEDGRPALKTFGPDGDWGTVLSPNCRGFTAAEFQMLDTKGFDISEFLDRYLNSDASWIEGMKPWEDVQQELQDAIRQGPK